MAPSTSECRRYAIAPRGRSVLAVCDCGWRSSPTSSGGLAGSAWDRHALESGRRARDQGTGTGSGAGGPT